MADIDEAERQRRLNELQMADLGTARREHISTVDTANKYRKVTIDQIEQVREANKKGTVGHRLAEANKTQLSAWNDAWKEVDISGDVDLEHLDSLMNGQSHRAHLTDVVKEGYGGQKYGHAAASKAAPRNAPKKLVNSGAPARGAAHVGNRGRRGSNLSSRKTPPGRPGLGPSNDPRRIDRPMDPSKDCNNRGSPTGGIQKKRGGMLGGGRPQRPPTMKTRRAVAAPPSGMSYESMLVDSVTFMDAVSSAVSSRTSQRSAQGSEEPVNDNSKREESPKPSLEVETVGEPTAVSEPDQSPVSEPANRDTTPPTSKIEAFSTPSPDSGKSSGPGPKLPRFGFNSSLPQPVAPWVASAFEGKIDSSANEHSLLDEVSESKLNTKERAIAPQEPPTPKEPEPLDTPEKSEPANNLSEMGEELDKLTKLLADASLLPAAAVSYLKERKEDLERKLSDGRAVVKLEDRVPSSQPLPAVSSLKDRKDTLEDNISDGGVVIKPDQHEAPKQRPRTLSHLNERQSIRETKGSNASSDVKSTQDQPPNKPSQAVPCSNEEKENLADGNFSKSQSDVKPEPRGFTSRLSAKEDPFGPPNPPGPSTSFPIAGIEGNIIGDYLLPGRGGTRRVYPSSREENSTNNKEIPPSPISKGLPPPNSQSDDGPSSSISATAKKNSNAPVAQIFSKLPPSERAFAQPSTYIVPTNAKSDVTSTKAKQPILKQKQENSRQTNDVPIDSPVPTATMQHFKEPAAQASPKAPPPSTADTQTKPETASVEVTQPALHPKKEYAHNPPKGDMPLFPVSAATMQYFKGHIPDSSVFSFNATSASTKPKVELTRERRPIPQVKQATNPPKPKNELPPNLPISAATMQYFKGSASSQRACAGSTHSRAAVQSTEVKSISQENLDNAIPLSRPVNAVPAFSISAPTLQLPKEVSEKRSQSMGTRPNAKDNSTGFSKTDTSTNKQQARAGLSPDASPFDPNGSNKENVKPSAREPTYSGSTLFQARVAKQGVSVTRGSGLNASKYAS